MVPSTAPAPSNTALLPEPEAWALLDAAGVPTPRRAFVSSPAELTAERLEELGTGDVVLKVFGPGLAHRTDVGGVHRCPGRLDEVRAGLRALEARVGRDRIEGFGIFECLPPVRSFGAELLVGLRWTAAFGPVVVVGPGGIDAELLAGPLGLAFFSPHLPGQRMEGELSKLRLAPILFRGQRGAPPLTSTAALRHVIAALLELATAKMPQGFSELEINPLAVTSRGLVALDVLARRGQEAPDTHAPRPIEKIARLLNPRTAAVVGVSRRRNPGHVLLENLISSGLPREAITVVKPGEEELQGCRCVPDVEALAGGVDVAFVALEAAASVDVATRLVAGAHAEAIVLIPGGLEEMGAAGASTAGLRSALDEARGRPDGGPILNGGNCVGLRSSPGRMDATFIPAHKMTPPAAQSAPLALICQSGAFMLVNMDRLAGTPPRYSISVGNQMDLTIGDYLRHFAGADDVQVVAVYLEGLRVGDGVHLLHAAEACRRAGKRVVLYPAGRTPAGAQASASHTASVAGDAKVLAALAAQAGIVVAEDLDDFTDLVALSVRFGGRRAAGRGLAAFSNAGYECVAFADNLGGFELAPLAPRTLEALQVQLEAAGVGHVVGAHNPLDVTPMMSDAAFADVASLLLDDPSVDVAVVGCVPMTGALDTLPSGDHGEDLDRQTSIVSRLAALFSATTKPWVVVVDGGARYAPMVETLRRRGVPTFTRVDRALRLLARWSGVEGHTTQAP